MTHSAGALGFTALLVLLLVCSPAFACSCMTPIDLSRFEEIARAFESADDVYSAAVEDVRSLGRPDATVQTGLQQAQLHVLQVWKGSYQPGQRLQVFTRNHPVLQNCAMEPAAGEALMIYARGSGSYAGISTCSRTGPLSRAFPDWPVLQQLVRMSTAEKMFPPMRGFGNRPPWLPDLLAYVYGSESAARDSARQRP